MDIDFTQYWITVAMGGACSVLASFFGAWFDDWLSKGLKRAWQYMPALLAGVAATLLPETVPGASYQTRWIFGLFSVSAWYIAYPYVEKGIRKNLETKTGAIALERKKENEPNNEPTS